LNDPRDSARAIDALRRGWPVVIDGALTVLAVESADTARLAAFDPEGRANILISAPRAATLKLTNQLAAANPGSPVVIARTSWLDLPAAMALADPATDLAHPLQGPYRAMPCAQPIISGAALDLARQAGLLPAFFVLDAAVIGAQAVTSAGIASWQAPERLAIAARARLPVAACESAEIVAFRTPEQAEEHVALVIGSPDGTPPLVRLHSECLTGDVFASLKCDCGPQLESALRLIADNGWGILLYLRQEGRGIGLINKLRAYQLQDQGFDTVDANVRLGFAVDARDFGVAARMLDLLGVSAIRLLTNNPHKVTRLEEAGVTIVERVPHQLPANPHNARYLATKRERTGHLLAPETSGFE
jgi:GTP cyclohydrolase II